MKRNTPRLNPIALGSKINSYVCGNTMQQTK